MNIKMMYTFCLISLFIHSDIFCSTFVSSQEKAMPTIELLQPHRAQEVKQLIMECASELWSLPESNREELQKELDTVGEFDDLVDVQTTYFDNRGVFLVLIDNEKIVGAGAIKNLDNTICELKRMWFLKEYRGRGLGKKMAQQLLDFAKQQGYTAVRLDVYYPEVQTSAVVLYQKLGFYEIPAYNNCPAKLFMEKVL
jgi:putative acetyltransferase